MPVATLDEAFCWEAIQKRDRSQDGLWFVGVVTTGVYCRPSCTSRHALRKNVRFYRTSQEAQRAGLRPCLRCRPLDASRVAASADKMWELCRYIDSHIDSDGDSDSSSRMDLEALAARAGLSRFHLQRTFKAVVGVTPKQYADARRMAKLKSGLKRAKDVTEAVYDAGFGSSSRVYERADTRLGMTPNQYRRGGEGVEITYAAEETALGLMMIGATDRGICFLQFGESPDELAAALRKEYPKAQVAAMTQALGKVIGEPGSQFRLWMEALRNHLAGRVGSAAHTIPLDIRATAFQMQVWNYLQTIPAGQVQSYSEVASGIGRPAAVRAVARACASNTVAIVIPCHRVIRGTGELGGYRWGLARKRALIDLERRVG
ncbi:MAG TPA: bifunctional DNA-binding transcriptional regulator/O6-methylguanine-DNA methyltransferase Ada [Candidatus Acidoferrales bacterium]|jgi:AraC family transcriptional regulator of adaptative response/methylated-DNA-[protein]-cysteine methyltransferase|nr:bifunctional DNA-binding transcriptional regulator/O6-methylguanine-DNA methyltransferase Ada [Candidatus Acidoferrales bacterium]